MQLKPSKFLQEKLEKFGLIREINARLHGDLICYVVSFKAECKWVGCDYDNEKRVVTISRGSADRCPYRIDYPAFGGGIHRDMFSLSHFDEPWNELCKKLWELDFGRIEFMGPTIGKVENVKLDNLPKFYLNNSES